MKFVDLLGIAGVAEHERPSARRWAKRFEWPLVFVALWIVVQWYLEETGGISHELARIADWLVWLAFFIETAVLVYQVEGKVPYLLSNWINLVIVIGGFPWFWQHPELIGLLRSFRLILVVALLLRMSRSARKLLAQHKLGNTLLVAVVALVLSGIVITRLEPAMGTIWDGMWWAWVTMATVGYGDVAPQTGAGRMFASLLILFGVVLLSLLTANLAAFFIGSDVKKVEHEEHQADALLADIVARLERIETELKQRNDQ